MQGFEVVMFIGIVGTITTGGTASLKAAQSSDDSSFSDLSGVVGAGAAGGSDKFLVLDVYKPLERYVRTTLTRAVANSIYGGTIAIQYGAHKRPTVYDAATIAAATVLGISPSEA